MKKMTDLLCVLIMFSIRAGFHGKALKYARVGNELYPNHNRLTDLFCHALILNQRYQEAEDHLLNIEEATTNTWFLRSQTAILLNFPKKQQEERVRAYIQARHSGKF